RNDPQLLPTARPFRPVPRVNVQQVRVKVWNNVFEDFDYSFSSERAVWQPQFAKNNTIQAKAADRELLSSLKLIPPEDKEWSLVSGLIKSEPSQNPNYLEAIREASPESGGFVLLSLRRRKLRAHDQ